MTCLYIAHSNNIQLFQRSKMAITDRDTVYRIFTVVKIALNKIYAPLIPAQKKKPTTT